MYSIPPSLWVRGVGERTCDGKPQTILKITNVRAPKRGKTCKRAPWAPATSEVAESNDSSRICDCNSKNSLDADWKSPISTDFWPKNAGPKQIGNRMNSHGEVNLQRYELRKTWQQSHVFAAQPRCVANICTEICSYFPRRGKSKFQKCTAFPPPCG